MANYAENDAFVRDLKAAAEIGRGQLDMPAPKEGALAGSRAAMLALISDLARGGGRPLVAAGVGAVALAGFATVNLDTVSIGTISRVLFWLLTVTLVLFFTAFKLRQFRQGYGYAGKPFTWRGHYTATLGTLSAVIGTGAMYLTPGTIGQIPALLICTGIMVIGLVMGAGHLAHRMAATTASLPAILFGFVAGLFHIFPPYVATFEASVLAAWGGALGVSAALYAIGNAQARRLIADALEEHPRHELENIRARHKKASGAYNPFSFRGQPGPGYSPAGLKPEGAVTLGNRGD